MTEELAPNPSPPPPKAPESAPESTWTAPRRYHSSRWGTWLYVDDLIINARELDRFTTIVVDKPVFRTNFSTDNLRTFEYEHGPRLCQWCYWGWDETKGLLFLLDCSQSELGEAIAASEHLDAAISLDASQHPEYRSMFLYLSLQVRLVGDQRLGYVLDDIANEVWYRDYFVDGNVLCFRLEDRDCLRQDRDWSISNPSLILAIATVEATYTTRKLIRIANPPPPEVEAPIVAKPRPLWQRFLIQCALTWPGYVASLYLSMWYLPNLYWSTAIFMPPIHWGIRIWRRWRWRRTYKALYAARTWLIQAQSNLSFEMSTYQLTVSELPEIDAKLHRGKLLARQAELAAESQALGVLERNFYVRHPLYARRAAGVFRG